jgi:hypothetical protein
MQPTAQAVGGKWKVRPKGAKEKLGTDSARTVQIPLARFSPESAAL